MKTLARLFFAAAALCLATPSLAARYSDLWYDPQESGWGMNVVQQLETAFVTLFVYDPEGRPTWYVAPDTRIVAYASTGPVFSGPLYATRGPWHGGAFDPAAVAARPVGVLSLEAVGAGKLRLHYTAEGISRVKEVVRQTWQPPIVAGNYAGQFILRQAPAQGPPYGTLHYQGDVLAHFDGGEGFLRVDDHLGRRCEYRGTHTQSGKLATVSGRFSCTQGDAREGTFELEDLEVSDHAISGYLRTQSAQGREFGRFAAARY